MTFINESGKSGVTREGIGARTEVALRAVRAKREADEAGQYLERISASLCDFVPR
jgi:hypothetical protein